MTALRSLFNDLVERRLWPVAVVLVLALVAIPVLLSGGTEAAPPPAPAPAPAPDASAPQVTVRTAALQRRSRTGSLRDPFKAAGRAAIPGPAVSAAPTVADAGAATGAGPARPAPSGSNAPSAPAGVAPAAPRVAVPTPITAAPRSTSSREDAHEATRYDVGLLTEVGSSLRKRTKVARLTALPKTDGALAFLLGVLADERTTVFLLGPGARATGMGACRPSPADCQALELRADQAAVVTGADGRRMRLDVLHVSRRGVSEKAAERSYGRVSEAGRSAVQGRKNAGTADGYGLYAYDWSRGLLVRRASAK